MKKISLIFIFCFFVYNIYAQRSTPALEWGGRGSVEYWGEQEAVVRIGNNFYTYLLYNSRGDRAQITSIVFNWFSRQNSGYIIDYSNVATFYPNDELAVDVIRAMVQYNSDISFTLIEEDSNTKRLTINFRSNNGKYYTTVFYFYRIIGG